MESSESAKEQGPSSEIPLSEAKDFSVEVAHSKEEEGEEEVSPVSERSSEVKDVSDELVERIEQVGGGSNLRVERTEIVFQKPSPVQFREASVSEMSTEIIVLQKDPAPIAPVGATEVPVSVPSGSAGVSKGWKCLTWVWSLRPR